MQASNDKQIEYLVSLFFKVGRLIRENTRDQEKVDPFTILQIETLGFIESEQPTMKAIADYLHIKAPSATSLVNGMVKSGYVKRIPDPADRRAVKMTITARGKSFHKAGHTQIVNHMKDTFSRLKKNQISNFIKSLEDIKQSYQ
jgi:DNA-binding MarR family transcriptional regulator